MMLKRHTLIPQRVEMRKGWLGEGCTICSCYWSKLKGHGWQVTATYLHDIDGWASSRPPTPLRNGPCCSSFNWAGWARRYSSSLETDAVTAGMLANTNAWHHLLCKKWNLFVFSHYSQMKEKCIFEMLWQFKFRRAQHLKVKTSSIKSKSGAKVWRVKLHN